MANPIYHRSLLLLLMLCLLTVSQFVLPVVQGLNISMSEISELDFDQVDLDDEIFSYQHPPIDIPGLRFQKFKSPALNFQIVELVPVSPPPKSA